MLTLVKTQIVPSNVRRHRSGLDYSATFILQFLDGGKLKDKSSVLIGKYSLDTIFNKLLKSIMAWKMNNLWYDKTILVADRLYNEHVGTLRKEGLIDG